MGQARKIAFLDSIWARLVALACAAAAGLALVYIHRDDIWPAPPEVAGDDAFTFCFAKRAADVDHLFAEGTISDAQAVQFKSRAEAMCRDISSGNNQVPGGVQ